MENEHNQGFQIIFEGLGKYFTPHTPPKSEKRHTSLVRKLENQLFQEYDYESMFFFLEYCRNGNVGEIDLLATADNIWDFYEVKCSDNYKSRKKARNQYHRFQNAFPEWDTNGFFYAGNKIQVMP